MLIEFGDIEIDATGYELRRSSELQSLEPKAFNLLLYLIENRDRVISKDEIYEAVWDGRLISEATLTSAVNAARTVIGDSGKLQKYIRTYPRRGYRFIGQLTDQPTASPSSSTQTSHPRNQHPAPRQAEFRPTQPSILVNPFTISSDDPEQQLIADGMAADISAELARFRRLFVISHNTAKTLQSRTNTSRNIATELGVRYALEGNVRRSGNRIRVVVQLLDSQTGKTVWADRYDHGLEDLFSIEDQITEAVATAIEPEILTYERGRLGNQPTDNMDAWQLLQKGLWHYYQQSRKAHGVSVDLFRQAVAVDPEYAHARAHLSFALWTGATLNRTMQPEADLKEAKDLARSTLARDPDEPLARFTLGRICLLEGETDFSVEHMRAGISAAPNYAGCHYGLGLALYHGRAEAEEALAHFDCALRLNPRNPMIWATYEKQSCANRYLGQFEDAVMFGLKARSFSNESYRPHLILAAAFAANGQSEDAQLEVQRSRYWAPDLSIESVDRKFTNVHLNVRRDLIGWLRTAGLE